jgi:hypothetical protein
VPIIGHISLGKDMKTALQEAEDAEHDSQGRKVLRDSKGKAILSEGEKAKRDEKEQKVAAEVSAQFRHLPVKALRSAESGCSCRTRA